MVASHVTVSEPHITTTESEESHSSSVHPQSYSNSGTTHHTVVTNNSDGSQSDQVNIEVSIVLFVICLITILIYVAVIWWEIRRKQ